MILKKLVLLMWILMFTFSCSVDDETNAVSSSGNDSTGGTGTTQSQRSSFSTQSDATVSPSVNYSPSYKMEEGTINYTDGEGNIVDSTVSDSGNTVYENPFIVTEDSSKSTFSIDVDNASYTYARNQINSGILPSPSRIRIEEFINYFDYNYPQPEGDAPFGINTKTDDCPWNKSHSLVHIGLQGKRIQQEDLKATNLVFLIDVSGSMGDSDKLPLLKKSFIKMVKNKLGEDNHVSLVTYSEEANLVLQSTQCTEANRDSIVSTIQSLESGGSTAGAAGIQLAYEQATNNFLENGINRVILATDGDFNVGISSEEELVSFIEKKRETGVFFSILGFGTGNYQDEKMEKLSNAGNGNYYYIDSQEEAEKVLGKDLLSNIVTIAKDVKIQVKFNQDFVKKYRLIGYENRVLANEDFENDSVDAGEIGPGHTVTALYEIVPYSEGFSVNNDLYNVRLRYKEPDKDESKLIEDAGSLGDGSDIKNAYWFSAAVAEFGLLLKNSEYKGNASYEQVIDLAESYQGSDLDGYRREFIDLVKKASKLGK